MAEEIVATYSDPQEYWLIESYDRMSRSWVRESTEYESFAAAASLAQQRAKNMKTPQRVIHWTKDPEDTEEGTPEPTPEAAAPITQPVDVQTGDVL